MHRLHTTLLKKSTIELDITIPSGIPLKYRTDIIAAALKCDKSYIKTHRVTRLDSCVRWAASSALISNATRHRRGLEGKQGVQLIKRAFRLWATNSLSAISSKEAILSRVLLIIDGHAYSLLWVHVQRYFVTLTRWHFNVNVQGFRTSIARVYRSNLSSWDLTDSKSYSSCKRVNHAATYANMLDGARRRLWLSYRKTSQTWSY